VGGGSIYGSWAMGGTLPRPTCRCMSSWVRASIIVSDSVTVMFVDGGRATLVGAQIALESPFISKKMRGRINHSWCCDSDVTASNIHKQSNANVSCASLDNSALSAALFSRSWPHHKQHCLPVPVVGPVLYPNERCAPLHVLLFPVSNLGEEGRDSIPLNHHGQASKLLGPAPKSSQVNPLSPFKFHHSQVTTR